MISTLSWAEYLRFAQIYDWKDPVEILVISFFFYHLCRWLKRDQQKNLVPHVYAYLMALGIFHYGGFYTLSLMMLIFSPAVALLWIVFHQDLLQRNFVSLKTIKPRKTINPSWIQELVRSCLHALAQNHTIKGIIEHTDSLSEYMAAPYMLDCSFDTDLLLLLVNSSAYNPDTTLWLSQSGNIRAINCVWKNTVTSEWQDETLKTKDSWYAQVIKITKHTDSIAFSCNQEGQFTLIAQGQLVEDISSSRALSIITQYINPLHSKKINTGEPNGPHASESFKNSTFNQPHA